MSRRLSDLNARIAKVERKAAEIAMREKLSTCNCYPESKGRVGRHWFVSDSKELEAAMSLPCPAHGFRRLGELTAVVIGPNTAISEECARRSELVEEYERRFSEYLKSHPELEDDI